MVSTNQIQNGLARYIDAEIVSKMTGWQRWVLGAGSGLALSNLNNIMSKWKDNEVVRMLGVIGEDGSVDVPRIYQEVKRQSVKGPITFNVPGMGSITLNDSDVDKLYNMIMGG
jgi:hypothetical protein